MKRLQQYEPLVIHDFEEEVFHLPSHSHTYYELVYIMKGKGVHFLNQIQMHYEPGDLFAISPEDVHYFDISESTRFVFIKFTDDYFSDRNHFHKNDALVKDPRAIMHSRLLKETKLTIEQPCADILRNTVASIVAYHAHKDTSLSPIIFYQLLTILGLIRESMAKLDIRLSLQRPDQENLLSYLHNNIYRPEQLQIKTIAAHFNVAPNYFSAYFKRLAGVSYRDYVTNYKLELIKKRIAFGHLTLKQIADEFGFIDESHLSHFFKRRAQVTPKEYRENIRSIAASHAYERQSSTERTSFPLELVA